MWKNARSGRYTHSLCWHVRRPTSRGQTHTHNFSNMHIDYYDRIVAAAAPPAPPATLTTTATTTNPACSYVCLFFFLIELYELLHGRRPQTTKTHNPLSTFGIRTIRTANHGHEMGIPEHTRREKNALNTHTHRRFARLRLGGIYFWGLLSLLLRLDDVMMIMMTLRVRG